MLICSLFAAALNMQSLMQTARSDHRLQQTYVGKLLWEMSEKFSIVWYASKWIHAAVGEEDTFRQQGIHPSQLSSEIMESGCLRRSQMSAISSN